MQHQVIVSGVCSTRSLTFTLLMCCPVPAPAHAGEGDDGAQETKSGPSTDTGAEEQATRRVFREEVRGGQGGVGQTGRFASQHEPGVASRATWPRGSRLLTVLVTSWVAGAASALGGLSIKAARPLRGVLPLMQCLMILSLA
jgi:hypothetical protein